jgi:citrate lyase subunit beta/citryl-CoA lyase
VRSVCSIERIRALAQVEEIAASHARLLALQIGTHDLSKEFGYRLDMTGPQLETLYAKSRCILAARLAGIEIGDSPYLFSRDLDGTLRSTLWSIQLGFTHKACHAAAQVPIVNRAFDTVENKDWSLAYLAAEHPMDEG